MCRRGWTPSGRRGGQVCRASRSRVSWRVPWFGSRAGWAPIASQRSSAWSLGGMRPPPGEDPGGRHAAARSDHTLRGMGEGAWGASGPGSPLRGPSRPGSGPADPRRCGHRTGPPRLRLGQGGTPHRDNFVVRRRREEVDGGPRRATSRARPRRRRRVPLALGHAADGRPLGHAHGRLCRGTAWRRATRAARPSRPETRRRARAPPRPGASWAVTRVVGASPRCSRSRIRDGCLRRRPTSSTSSCRVGATRDQGLPDWPNQAGRRSAPLFRSSPLTARYWNVSAEHGRFHHRLASPR